MDHGASLTVRTFLRYEIEKGLRAAYVDHGARKLTTPIDHHLAQP